MFLGHTYLISWFTDFNLENLHRRAQNKNKNNWVIRHKSVPLYKNEVSKLAQKRDFRLTSFPHGALGIPHESRAHL